MVAPATIAAIVVLVLWGAAAAQAEPGDLDTTYAGDGSAQFATAAPDGIGVTDLAIQSDGRIVELLIDGTLRRFNTDGTIDATFGTNGLLDLSSRGTPVGLAPMGAGYSDAFVVAVGKDIGRFTRDGVPDPTFASNAWFRDSTGPRWVGVTSGASVVYVDPTGAHRLSGIGVPDRSYGYDGDAPVLNAYGTVYQLDAAGRLLAGGPNGSRLQVQRLGVDGLPDPTFAQRGSATFSSLPPATAIGVTTDGRVYVSGHRQIGTSDWDLYVARLTIDGRLDPAFSQDGIDSADLTPYDQTVYDLVVQPDDKPVIASEQYACTSIKGLTTCMDHDMAVARFGASGGLDTTFSGDGWQIINPSGDYGDTAQRLGLRFDSRIVVAGISGMATGGDAVVQLTTAGVLDTSFSGDGIWIASEGQLPYFDAAQAIEVQGDDKALEVGFTTITDPADITSHYEVPAAIRVTTTGILDTTFSGDGIATAPTLAGAHFTASALQSDGKLVAAGTMVAATEDFFIARFTTAGVLDTSFSGDGILPIPVASTGEEATGVAIQPDGKIVVAGRQWGGSGVATALARSTAAGVVDTTFSGDGIQTLDLASSSDVPGDVLVQPDGRILIAANGSNSFGLARLLADGSLDTSFGSGGIAQPATMSGSSSPPSLALRSDGRVLVTGTDTFSSQVIASFTTGGTLDATFGTTGIASLPLGMYQVSAIALESTGKIIVAGEAVPYDTIVRLTANGVVDTTFSTDGVTVPDAPDYVNAMDLAYQSDGRILVAGSPYFRIDRLQNCISGATCTPDALAPSRWTNDSTPTLSASPFLDPGSDTFQAAQWQVRDTSGTYAAPVVDSGTVGPSRTWDVPSALSEAGTFWFHVRYQGSDGTWTSWSNEVQFRVDTQAPVGGSISGLSGATTSRVVSVPFVLPSDGVSGVDPTSVSLQRHSASYSGASCQTYGSWADVGTANPTSPYVDTLPSTNTCFEYRLVLQDRAGNQAVVLRTIPSRVITTVVPDTTPPDIPQGRALQSRTTSSVEMRWSPSVDDSGLASTYDVEFSVDGSTWSSGCANVAQLTCTISGLAADTPVYLRVRARDHSNMLSAWGYWADATSARLRLHESSASTNLTNAAVRRIDPTFQALTGTTSTPDMDGKSGFWQFQPGGAGVASATMPAGITPSTTGRGWFSDEGAGSGGAPGGINDGPLTVGFSTTGGKVDGTAKLRVRLFSTGTSAGAVAAPTTLLTDSTGGSNVFVNTTVANVIDEGRIDTPLAFPLGQSLYLESWLSVQESSGGAGTQPISLAGEAYLESAHPGVRPSAPTSMAPADGAVASTMSATYTHPTGVAGHLVFEVWTNVSGSPGALVQTGYSAFERATGANGSWTPSQLPDGTYMWRVQSEDRYGRVSGFTTYRTIVVSSNALPSTVLVAPADGASTSDDTPDLTATFSDPDGADTGTISFQVCKVATCTDAADPVATATSSAGVGNGATSAVTSPILIPGTWYWRARSTDSKGGVGPWTATRSLTITTSLTIGVDASTVSLGILTPGIDSTGVSSVTVTTNSPGGYVLGAHDDSDTTALTDGSNPVPDWTGSGAAPTTWTTGTLGYVGLTVLGASGGSSTRLVKWGAGTGTAANDFANNRYAGIASSSDAVLHQRLTSGSLTDVVSVAYRATIGAGQPMGSYTDTFSYTAVAQP
jgi:uncharacterized delta-60 repeat protein